MTEQAVEGDKKVLIASEEVPEGKEPPTTQETAIIITHTHTMPPLSPVTTDTIEASSRGGGSELSVPPPLTEMTSDRSPFSPDPETTPTLTSDHTITPMTTTESMAGELQLNSHDDDDTSSSQQLSATHHRMSRSDIRSLSKEQKSKIDNETSKKAKQQSSPEVHLTSQPDMQAAPEASAGEKQKSDDSDSRLTSEGMRDREKPLLLREHGHHTQQKKRVAIPPPLEKLLHRGVSYSAGDLHMQAARQSDDDAKDQGKPREDDDDSEDEKKDGSGGKLTARSPGGTLKTEPTPRKIPMADWRNYVPVENVLTKGQKAHFKYDGFKKLGSGPFARVYRTKRKDPRRQVAVKVFYRSNLQAEISFSNEIKVLKDCDHPNIIHLHDVFVDKKYYYLEMELCQGGDLWSYMVNCDRTTEMQARVVCKQLLDVLDWMHRHNLAHRDMKPENIVLLSAGDLHFLRVIDFGEAIEVSLHHGTYPQQVGTLCYFAPERWGSPTGIEMLKSDVWAVGLITWELMAGQRYYSTQELTTAELVKEIRHAPLEIPSYMKITGECRDFLEKLLNKDPNERLSASQAFQHPWLRKKPMRHGSGGGGGGHKGELTSTGSPASSQDRVRSPITSRKRSDDSSPSSVVKPPRSASLPTSSPPPTESPVTTGGRGKVAVKRGGTGRGKAFKQHHASRTGPGSGDVRTLHPSQTQIGMEKQLQRSYASPGHTSAHMSWSGKKYDARTQSGSVSTDTREPSDSHSFSFSQSTTVESHMKQTSPRRYQQRIGHGKGGTGPAGSSALAKSRSGKAGGRTESQSFSFTDSHTSQ